MRRSFGSILRRKRKDGTLLPGYYITWTDATGRRVMRKAGSTRLDAERALSYISGELHLERGDAPPLAGVAILPLAEVAPRILAVWKSRLAAGTLKGRPSALRRWVLRLGQKPVGEISRLDVQEAANALALDHKASSVDTEVAILSEAFKALKTDLGYDRDNPCHGLKLPRVQLRPRPHLRPDQVAALLAACPPSIQGMVTLLADAGLRPAELFRLTWGEVSFDLGSLRLVQTKTYRTRTIPFTAAARAVLEAERAALGETPAPGERVFHVGEKPFRVSFREAARRAGLPDLMVYDLRHAYASSLLMAGASPSVVRDLLGHGSLVTTDRYLRSLPGDAPRAAVDALEKSRAGIPPRPLPEVCETSSSSSSSS
ncbi:MAG: site-specific integrase [Planctomycetaceae bacterium]|nr:site-specific integrase [Planctomycetaceae bacterium]